MPSASQRFPSWLRRPIARNGAYSATGQLLDELGLNTVCQSAKCPNRGECFSEGTATFLIMGGACTRDCRFCAIESRRPEPLDPEEPERVAQAAARMGLKHVVVTSVTRDDLPDGGAAHFSATIGAVRALLPDVTVEVLTPDFGGDEASIDVVSAALPDVFNHNVETVPRLYSRVRPKADYERSLRVLARVHEMQAGLPTKSGIMLGLGETTQEVTQVLEDLRGHGVSMVTLGQYLRPGPGQLPVSEFVEPSVFAALAKKARAMGFSAVASAPFVRSSYHAKELSGESSGSASGQPSGSASVSATDQD